MRAAFYLAFGFLAVSSTLATAEQHCIVADPSGTPLNVRAQPYGAILGALSNGAVVRKLETTQDYRGQLWSYIAPIGPGRSGWVYRDYLTCD